MAGDFDADGDSDLLAIDRLGAARFFANEGGVFRERSNLLPASLTNGMQHAQVTDLDEDGADDIAFVSSDGDALNTAASPSTFAGLNGNSLLDLGGPFEMLSVRPVSRLATSTSFVQLPNLPQILGADLYFQAAVLLRGSAPSGFTNILRETVLH